VTRDEYATLIYYWAGHPQPERIPEILRALMNSEWAWPAKRQLPIAGVVQAFESMYPDRAAGWHIDFGALYARLHSATDQAQDCPEWTDYHLAQWPLLRSEKCIDAVLDRVADGGEVGASAQIKLQELASQSVPFRKALEKARESRKLAMIIQ
jgi:hypothetical protein